MRGGQESTVERGLQGGGQEGEVMDTWWGGGSYGVKCPGVSVKVKPGR